MRRALFVLSLLCASNAVVAQNENVLILKSEQPYVSPFDKAPSGKFAAPSSSERVPAASPARSDTDTKDSDRLATERRAQEFVNRAAQKPPVRKNEPVRKKDEPRAVAKREDPKAETLKNTVVQTQDNRKTPAVDSAGKVASTDASVIPPKNTQHAKAELAPPPPPIAVKENALTSFGKDSGSSSTPEAAAVAPASAVAAAPAVSAAPSQPSAAAPVANVPALAPPIAMAPGVLVNPEETPAAVRDTQTQQMSAPETVESAPWVAALAWKAGGFFAVGLVLMLLGWFWLKRQASRADPALKDPWFRPIKTRQ